MGFLDKLKERLRKPQEEPKLAVLNLDLAARDTWTDTFVQKLGLMEEFTGFSAQVETLRKGLLAAINRLTNEQRLHEVPERARTVTELHATEYGTQAKRVAQAAVFSDLFTFETQRLAYQAEMEQFRERSVRNASALQEHLGNEVKRVQEFLQQIEDKTLAMLSFLESKGFPDVLVVRDAARQLHDLDERRQKYLDLQHSLQEDLARTGEKRARIEQVMRDQRGLVRNEDALHALDALQRLDTELRDRLALYTVLGRDLASYFKKYPQVTPPVGMKEALGWLASPLDGIATHGDAIVHALRLCAEQLDENGQGNTAPMLKRLLAATESLDADIPRCTQVATQQKDLKRRIMRDIAAVRVYDQQQFLEQATAEQQSLQTKLAYLDGELSPRRRIELLRQLKDAALRLGAEVEGTIDEMPAAEPDEEPHPTAALAAEDDVIASPEETPVARVVQPFATVESAQDEVLAAAQEAEAEIARAEQAAADAVKPKEPVRKKRSREELEQELHDDR